MGVINGEFHYSNEYNKTTEYKRFPAELYHASKELGNAGKEYAPSGAEITTSSQKLNEKKTNNGNLVDTLLNSFKGIAATTTAAAVVVLGATTIAPPPKIELLDLSVGGNYVEYEISVEELQDDLEYFIIISTSNEPDREFIIEEDGIYKNKAEGLRPTWEYSLSFVSHDEYLGTTTYFETTFQTSKTTPEPQLPSYNASVSNVTVSGFNEIRIDFNTENLDETCSLELLLNYSEGEQVFRPITKRELERGYATIDVSESPVPISVQPILTYGEEEQFIEFTPYECNLDNSLTADVQVNDVTKQIVFYLKGITNGATLATVINTETSEEISDTSFYDNYVAISYETETPTQYSIFLTNDEGEKMTGEYISPVITPTVQETGEYVLNYKNPNDVGITYNDDGTINVYIQTDFSSTDERVYYQILLGTMRFRSRETTFVAEGIPNSSYPLIYEVFYDDNGIQYCINSISVSGIVNEFDYDYTVNAEIFETTVSLSIDLINLESIRVVTSSGEEIVLPPSELIYDEDLSTYTAEVQFSTEFEWITIYSACSPFAEDMAGIDDYAGSLTVEKSTTFYKNT